MKRQALLDELKAEYCPEGEQFSYSNDKPILLIEGSLDDNEYWFTLHGSLDEAARYHTTQETSDWGIEFAYDLRDGTQYDVAHTTIEWKKMAQ